MNKSHSCRIKILVRNRAGIHTGPSIAIYHMLLNFPRNKFTVAKDASSTPSKGILGIMTLAVDKNETFYLNVEGPNADNIGNAVKEFIEYGIYRIEVSSYLRNWLNDQLTTSNQIDIESLALLVVENTKSDLLEWIKISSIDEVIDELAQIVYKYTNNNKSTKIFKVIFRSIILKKV